MKALQSDNSEGSSSNCQPINPTTKLQCWKDVAGGKSRGQCYGTADLASNIRHGVSSLTQPSIFAPSSDYFSLNEQLHQQVMQANEKADQATQRADQATQIAAQANQKCAMLEDKIKFMEQKLIMMMERQQVDTSTCTSQVHPHYARKLDDQPLP